MTKPPESANLHARRVWALCACFIAACAGTGPPVDDAADRGGGAGQQAVGDDDQSGGAGVSAGAGGSGGQGAKGGAFQAGNGGTAGPLGGQAGAPSGGQRGGGCEGGELLCEDFENVTIGALPSGGAWVARDSSCSSGMFSMGVSAERPHGGNRSLKVTNHSWPQCRLAGKFDAVDEFWVRAYVYWETSVDFADKEILALDLIPPSGLNKDDPAVRFGSRTKDPCKGSPGPQITIIGMGGGEQSGCSANEPAKGQWHCFEALVRQPNKLSVQTYIDGRALTYQSSGKPVSMSVETTDAISQKVNHLRLGFFTHNSTGVGNVFIDDVVVALQRVGCGG